MALSVKELMIDDWVSVLARFIEVREEGNSTNGTYKLSRKNCRVVGVNENAIAIDKICSDVISYDPIPLTPEILEANGWKLLSNFDREAYYSKDGEFNLNIHNGRLRLFINSCVVTIEYVHELQHALRLCGLTELADNFKLN